MPTDNSRMVFFPSMLAKYSTVGFVWRMLRRLPYSLPFPIQADGSTNCALLVVCKCRAFGQCVCLAVSTLFFAPVFTPIPGFGRPGLSRPAASSPFQIPYKKPLAASGVHPRPRARRWRQRCAAGMRLPGPCFCSSITLWDRCIRFISKEKASPLGGEAVTEGD